MDKMEEALNSVSKCESYNRWVFSLFERYVGDSVLEIGSGLGDISKFFKNRKRLVLVDNNKKFISHLENEYKGKGNAVVIRQDINEDITWLKKFCPDTVVCVNVLEHIEDDSRLLKKIHDILQPGGNMIILAPALKSLYSDFDVMVGHHRRYSKRELRDKIVAAGFREKSIFYFNILGALGWFVCFKIMRSQKINERWLGLFDKIVFILKNFERLVKPALGLSIVVICAK